MIVFGIFWMYLSENEKTFIFFFHVLSLRFHSQNRLNLVYIPLRIDYRRKIVNGVSLVVQCGRENETSMKPNKFLDSANDEDFF